MDPAIPHRALNRRPAARIGGVIDFCFAGDELDPARRNGYHALCRLAAIERDACPVLLRAVALRFWLSRPAGRQRCDDTHLGRAKDPDPIRETLRRRVCGGSRAPWI